MSDDGSDEESYETILPQALPVVRIKGNVDLNIPPATGEEYLSRVRLEASKCPDVVIANLDTSKFSKDQTIRIPFQSDTATVKVATELLPKIEWQREKCVEFSNLRLKVAKNRSEFMRKNKPAKKIKLPKLDLTIKWFDFCFGPVRQIIDTKPDQEQQQASNEGKPEVTEPHAPLLSLLYSMDQPTIVQLFDYQVEWFEEKGYSDEACKWIFALMAFLEKPLLPETCSSLRSLARTCIKLRNEVNDPENPSLTPLNLFIAIIGRYFEQTDLADP